MAGELAELYALLDEAMASHAMYDAGKEERISSLKNLLQGNEVTPGNAYYLTKQIIGEY